MERLTEVFEGLKNACLKLQPDKCEFLKKEVCYSGHNVTNEGVKPDPDKIRAVKDKRITLGDSSQILQES